MTKQEIVSEISAKTGIEKDSVMRTIESLMETVKVSMTKGKSVYLRGFGTFEVVKRAKKTGRNISMNTAIVIPEHFVPKFKPSKKFVNKVKVVKH